MPHYCLSQLGLDTILYMAVPEDKLNELKESLLSDKKRIEHKISILKETDFGDSPGTDNEEADETEELANQLATVSVLEKRLDNIGFALEKIEKGEYGVCESCKNDISLELLQANPESHTCKECK